MRLVLAQIKNINVYYLALLRRVCTLLHLGNVIWRIIVVPKYYEDLLSHD